MISEEKYEFTSKAKKTLIIFLVVGIVLSVLGYFTMGTGSSGAGHGDAHAHGNIHGAVAGDNHDE